MALRQFWFLDQFKSPKLSLDSANIMARNDSDLLLDDEDMEFQVTLDSAAVRDETLERLRALCQPNPQAWSQLRFLEARDPLVEIVDALYIAGYIKEVAGGGQHDALLADWCRTVALYVGSLMEHAAGLDQDRKAVLLKHVGLLRDEVRRLLRVDGAPSAAGIAEQDLWATENFYLLTMIIQLRYAHRNNVLGIGLIHQLLSLLAHQLGLEQAAPDSAALTGPLRGYLVNVYHGRDAEACLYAFTELLQASSGPDAARKCQPAPQVRRDMAGINFAIDSEEHARQFSGMLGQSAFFEALQEPANHLKLAPACYLQEYFVNYRFVETITPMITKRLKPKLKEMFWRYYSEEIGHEQFELDTCKQLGIDEEFIAANLPLPMTQAFCDTLSYLSECEEIGYLTSVMVTEGMPGEPSLINQTLARSPVLKSLFNSASLAHEELNQELAHQFLSRIFLSQIASVDPQSQTRALQVLSYMVELNFRAWEDLHQRVMIEGQPYMAPARRARHP